MINKNLSDLQEYQKDLLYTLLSNRFLIERLTNKEISVLYKFFKKENKIRKREEIKRIICIVLFGYRNI